jgi:tRNA (cytidine/uridine-2'-O-)-methyltransferase
MRLALYQPDIPQNTGALLRLAACLGVEVDLIEPAGFVLSDKRLRRAGMDYMDRVPLTRHASWDAYENACENRLVLLTTRADMPFTAFGFEPGDTLLLGRESAGVPEDVHARADGRLRVPMVPGARSLNVALAASMVLSEALRQTRGFPATSPIVADN